MFIINNDKSIYLTRGDIASIEVSAYTADDLEHVFVAGDVVRFKVFEKNRCDMVMIKKDVVVETNTVAVEIALKKEDTKIGELIHAPKDYWYEVELNPDTAPQTIIGYDTSGPKIFRLFPEGDDVNV